MSLAIHELESQAPVDSLSIDAFIGDHEFPLIEGTTATFVYRGEADEVFLTHWVYGLPSSQAFKRMPGSDLWFFTFDLPRKSRVEYKLEIVSGDEHRLIQDPLNPNLAADPYGANSVVHGEGYESPEWTRFDPDARPGELKEHRLASQVFGDVRSVSVYVPARFRQTRRYPLLIVHDGQDFLRFTELKCVLDNLIHRLEIPPVVVAMVDSTNRLTEYADDERHADFLAKELLPVMEDTYPLLETPGGRGLVGASFGAVASLSAAWRHPGVFGNLLLLSGSFAFTDIGDHERGPVFDPVVKFVNEFRKNPGRPAERIYLTCGMYESLIYYNRSIVPLLQSTGMSVRFKEARDGHNWENWRDRLREGLAWLMPGPLWMVYE